MRDGHKLKVVANGPLVRSIPVQYGRFLMRMAGPLILCVLFRKQVLLLTINQTGNNNGIFDKADIPARKFTKNDSSNQRTNVDQFRFRR